MLIKIKNLRLKTVIGIHPFEEKINRDIIINAIITVDYERSLQSDNIEDTLDYDSITTKIKSLIAANRYKLIEKMACEVVNLIMAEEKVSKCELEIDKVGAVENVDSFSITLIETKK
jgi:FolB domain-containing protein